VLGESDHGLRISRARSPWVDRRRSARQLQRGRDDRSRGMQSSPRRRGSAEPGGAISQDRASTRSSLPVRAGLSRSEHSPRWEPPAGSVAQLAICEIPAVSDGETCLRPRAGTWACTDLVTPAVPGSSRAPGASRTPGGCCFPRWASASGSWVA